MTERPGWYESAWAERYTGPRLDLNHDARPKGVMPRGRSDSTRDIGAGAVVRWLRRLLAWLTAH